MSQQPGEKKFPGGKAPRPRTPRAGAEPDSGPTPEKVRRPRTPRAQAPDAIEAPVSTPKPRTSKPKPASQAAPQASAGSKPRASSASKPRAAKQAPAPPPDPAAFWQPGPLVLWAIRWLARQRGAFWWVALLITLAILLLPRFTVPAPTGMGVIAPLFAREVRFWEEDIARWAETYGVDPNLVATLMQIESCGHPDVVSSAGAQGLFQVMPFHFSAEEQAFMTDPDTNALRGMGVIVDCLERADGNFGLAMACYNGGPRRIAQPQDFWPDETRRYYRWGTGIYADALRNAENSATLEAWYQAGGWGLCQRASAALRMVTSTPYLAPVEYTTPTLPVLVPESVPVATVEPPPRLPTLEQGNGDLPIVPAPGALPTFSGFGG